jgi:hypothetical protein
LCLCGVFLMKYKESKAMHFYQLVQSTWVLCAVLLLIVSVLYRLKISAYSR